MDTAEYIGTQVRVPNRVYSSAATAAMPGVSEAGNYASERPDQIVIFLGAPGSGKGTQSSMLASRFGIPCISTGEILRHAAKQDTREGIHLRRIMASGGLVDDETVCQAVIARVRHFRASSGGAGRGLILDGFPRNLTQAKRLDSLLESLGMAGPLVVHLDVPYAVLRNRLGGRRQCAECGAVYGSGASTSHCQVDGSPLVEREDDSRGIVERRLSAYEAETLPLVEYYRTHEYSNATYRRIDGSLGVTEIAKGVCEILSLTDAPLAA